GHSKSFAYWTKVFLWSQVQPLPFQGRLPFRPVACLMKSFCPVLGRFPFLDAQKYLFLFEWFSSPVLYLSAYTLPLSESIAGFVLLVFLAILGFWCFQTTDLPLAPNRRRSPQ